MTDPELVERLTTAAARFGRSSGAVISATRDLEAEAARTARDALKARLAELRAQRDALLAACELWDQGFTEGEQFTPEQLLAWVNRNRRAAREAVAKAKGA